MIQHDGDLLDVPMVFSGNRKFVEGLNDPLINKFLEQLPDGDFLFDSRSHLLQKGMYPCIPGWHLDHIVRKSGELRLYDSRNIAMVHYIMFLGDAPTLVLDHEVSLDVARDWQGFDEYIQAGVIAGRFTTTHIPEGKVYKLRWFEFHKGTPAQMSGKRVFMRASFNVDHIEARNEIRKQTQVYVPLNYGW